MSGTRGEVTPALILNETALMAIGILMGVVMNLYIPRRIRAIREDQRITEERMRAILRDMGAFLRQEPFDGQTDPAGKRGAGAPFFFPSGRGPGSPP